MFDLDLNPASTFRHDATSREGRNVEIKLTQGRGIAIRHEPEHLLVLHRPRVGPIQVVFNGPGVIAWAGAGKMQKNGQRPISLSKLALLSDEIAESDRLPVLREPPV